MKKKTSTLSKFTYNTLFLQLLFLFLLSSISVKAQISMTATPVTYTQNFDGLAMNSPGTNVTWADNTTIPGWFTNQTSYRTYNPSDATPNNRFWSCGATNTSTDRALGAIMTSTTVRAWGAAFTNNTGATLGSITVGFAAESYYTTGAGCGLKIQYSKTSTSVGDALTSTNWTDIATVSTANTYSYVLAGLNLTVGSTVYVRFIPAYTNGSDFTLWASDNFTANWAPEVPPTVLTTAANATGKNTATASGNITSAGTFPVTVSGVCWNTTGTPTTADSKTTDGTLTGTYTSNITGLTAGTLYHVRAYATNAKGTSYGADLTFTTAAPTLAILTTTAASGITPISALSGGNITDDGGATITERGVCWNTTGTPTTTDSKSISGTGAGAYTTTLSILAPVTSYHARAYAISSIGIAYGNEITFTTSVAAPILVTNPTSLAFGTVQQGNTSPVQSYTLTGYFLTPAAGSITVTAPNGYQVSTSSTSGFASAIQVAYTGSTLATTTIYVRFAPISLSNYNKQIVNSGGGSANANVTVTGAIAPVGGQGQQGFSNKGTDFWTGFGLHEKITGANGTNSNALMKLYFTADVASTVTIYVGNNLVETLSVPAGSITASNIIPYAGTDDARLLSEQVYVGKGIYIHSNNPIVAYAENYGSQVTAATVLFPVNTLGKSYTALNYTQLSNAGGNASARSYAFVVATQDNTTIKVTMPAGTTSEGGITSTGSTKLLNKGDVWLIKGDNGSTDITGTIIESISSSSGGCQPIAVFSGSGKISISCDGSTGSGDNLFQQAFPSAAWGRTYVSAPTAGTNYANNIYRVMINPATATTVTVNGITLPNVAPIPGISTASTTSPSTSIALTNGLFYEFRSNVPVVINATSPVMVAQYISNASKCGNNYSGTGGDPDMVYLSSVEQTIDKIIVSPIETDNSNTTNYINVVIKTVDAPNFTIKDQTNTSLTANFIPINATYSYAQIQVASGYSTSVYYNLNCTSGGYNAISYGYAASESYAYNAGTNLVDLLSGFNIQNQYSSGASTAACKGSQFYMSITLAFKPLSIVWDFSNNTNLSPNATVTQSGAVLTNTNVLIDSVQINGTWLYTYQIPTPYTYNAVGTFNVKIGATNPTPDGCNGLKEFVYPITVIQGADANYTVTNTNGCLAPIQFTDASTPNGQTINSWSWIFGDATTSNVQNPPIHNYALGGSYNTSLQIIGANGCSSTKTQTINISAKPVAAFTPTPATACVGTNINFQNNSSIAAPGVINTYAWNFGDATTSAVNGNVTHAYTTAGNPFNATLQVTSSTGCVSTVFSSTITIFTPPTATPVVKAIDSSINSVTFGWAAVTGAISYQVSIDGGATYITPSGPGLTHVVGGLTPNQTVTLIVKAIGGSIDCFTTGTATGKSFLPNVGVFVPNTFTPNGDGKNDVLYVRANLIQSVSFMVFNQWGEKVFETKNASFGWDGRYKGQPAPAGVYIFTVSLTTTDGKTFNDKGSVNLIR